MYPLLIKIGPVPIHTYGFLIAIGFLVALYVIKRLCILSRLDVDKVLDVTFWSLIVGFIGARIFFIFTRLDTFLGDPLSVFKVWEGGLVFFGGPIAVVPFAAWYLKKHQISYWKAMDVLIPGLVIGHMFGRFGCLAAGCCYGKPTGTSFGVRLYSDLVERAFQGIPLHPTQIYEASALFMLFIGLLVVYKRRTFDGQVGLVYFMVYPIIRSIVEIFRGDTVRGFLIEDVLSTGQTVSILVFTAALVTLIIRLKKAREEQAGALKTGGLKK